MHASPCLRNGASTHACAYHPSLCARAFRGTRRWRIAACLVALAPAAQTYAQIEWRLSIKVLLDSSGNRAPDDFPSRSCEDPLDPSDHADLNEDAEIYGAIDRANAILDGYGRGYRFKVIELIDLGNLPAPPSSFGCCSGGDNDNRECSFLDLVPCPGGGTCVPQSTWFEVHSFCAKEAIQEAATENAASKALWAWSEDAVNIYILGSWGSGRGAALGAAPMVLGQALTRCNTPFHELGHTFGLCHTHGCRFSGGSVALCDGGSKHDDECDPDVDCPDGECEHGTCVGGPNDGDPCNPDVECPGGTCTRKDEVVRDDEICDTKLKDNSFWDTQDQVAIPNFGVQHASLTLAQQRQVDDLLLNLMAYHWDYQLLTQGQLDRMTDTSNWDAYPLGIATGRTWFVDAYPGDCTPAGVFPTGSSKTPFRTAIGGISAADPGDIVLFRPGFYNETLVIRKRVTLLAARGNVILGGP